MIWSMTEWNSLYNKNIFNHFKLKFLFHRITQDGSLYFRPKTFRSWYRVDRKWVRQWSSRQSGLNKVENYASRSSVAQGHASRCLQAGKGWDLDCGKHQEWPSSWIMLGGFTNSCKFYINKTIIKNWFVLERWLNGQRQQPRGIQFRNDNYRIEWWRENAHKNKKTHKTNIIHNIYFNQVFVRWVVVYSDQLLGARYTLIYLITIICIMWSVF